MALINRDYIPALLRPGANTIYGDYNVFPDLWTKIYAHNVAKHAVEYDVEIQGLPLATKKPEGSPTFLADMKQAYITAYTIYTYSIGFQITREAIEDNVYQDQFPQQALNLRNSMSTLKNTNGAYVFNNATNLNSVGNDGEPLLSTKHPTAQGTLANTFSNGVGLNETSLEEAITMIKQWTNVAGLPIDLSARKLLVPTGLNYQASRLLNTAYRTGTANHDISAIVHDKHIPGGFIVNRFITNPGFWGLITDHPNGFKYFSKVKANVDFLTDTNTDNVMVRILERYAMGYTSWRGFFGSIGAS